MVANSLWSGGGGGKGGLLTAEGLFLGQSVEMCSFKKSIFHWIVDYCRVGRLTDVLIG